MSYRTGGRYTSRGSSSGGGYRSGGGGSGDFGRRDMGPPRRSFGSLERRGGGGDSYPSPWESGHGPSRSSWGSSVSGLLPTPHGRSGSDGMYSQLGGGGQDTLNVAASLVSALLQNQRPSSGSYPPRYEGGYPSRSHSSGGYRASRSDNYRSSDFASSRDKFGSSRREFGSLPRGRGTSTRTEFGSLPRGRGTSARGRSSRGAYKSSPSTRKPVSTTKNGVKKETKKTPNKAQKEADEIKAAKLDSELAAKNGKSDDSAVDLIDESELKDAAKDDEDDIKVLSDSKEKGDESSDKPARERINSEYLNCGVCELLKMTSESAFVDHVRGWKHQQMMELMEQRLEYQAKLIRLEIQSASKRSEMENRRRQAKGLNDRKREYSYCSMCAIRVYGVDLITHRASDELHTKLKNFLHPRCCGLRFDTPVLYERHLLSFSHFRRMQQREKEMAEAGTDLMAVGITPKPPVADITAETDVSMKEPTEGEEATATDAAAATTGEEGDVTEKKSEEEAGEGPIPAMFDEKVAVGVTRGFKFDGMFCTVCRLSMPETSWDEHCRSQLHFQRYGTQRRVEERAARRAAEPQPGTEADEVQVEDDGEGDEEARGLKRAAEDAEDSAAKLAAIENGDELPEGCHVVDEVTEEDEDEEEEQSEEKEEEKAEEVTVEEVVEEETPVTEQNGEEEGFEQVLDAVDKELDTNGAAPVVEVEDEKKEEALAADVKVRVTRTPTGRGRGSPRGATTATRGSGGVARRSRARGRR